jgi:hypothetical protein
MVIIIYRGLSRYSFIIGKVFTVTGTASPGTIEAIGAILIMDSIASPGAKGVLDFQKIDCEIVNEGVVVKSLRNPKGHSGFRKKSVSQNGHVWPRGDVNRMVVRRWYCQVKKILPGELRVRWLNFSSGNTIILQLLIERG